jgi:hypothetical protein
MNLQRSQAQISLHHHHSRTAERVAEIADILAAGLMRLIAPKSSQMSRDGEENCLDILATESGHSPRRKKGETR